MIFVSVKCFLWSRSGFLILFQVSLKLFIILHQTVQVIADIKLIFIFSITAFQAVVFGALSLLFTYKNIKVGFAHNRFGISVG